MRRQPRLSTSRADRLGIEPRQNFPVWGGPTRKGAIVVIVQSALEVAPPARTMKDSQTTVLRRVNSGRPEH